MVTTRSADKRNNAAQDELVLRSKATQSPSPSSSTPTAVSRKRPTNVSSTPRSKRARLDLTDAQNNSKDNLPNKDLAVTYSTEALPDGDIAFEPSNQAASPQMQFENPPRSVSTPKRAVTGPPPQTADDTSHGIQRSSHGDLKFFTPMVRAHKHFSDSQEPEESDTANTNNNGNLTGTDSSAHQEYQTAEEENIDSDEAPDLETSKLPSSNPIRGTEGRTPRGRKIKKTAKREGTLADVPENQSTEAPLETAGPAVTVLPPLTPPRQGEDQQPLSPFTGTAERAQQIQTAEVSASSAQVAMLSQTETMAAAIETAELPQDAIAETTAPESRTSFPSVDSTSTNPVVYPNFINLASSEKISQPVKLQVLTKVSPLSVSVLPRKSHTSLSSHRRALLENRAQRSGGAFRLQTSWAKKRKPFAV